MAGEEAWDSTEVKTVFETRRPDAVPPDRLPRPDLAGGRTEPSTEDDRHVPVGALHERAVPEEERDDIDFFTFPEIDSAIGADAIDALIDGFCNGRPGQRGGSQGFPRPGCPRRRPPMPRLRPGSP